MLLKYEGICVQFERKTTHLSFCPIHVVLKFFYD